MFVFARDRILRNELERNRGVPPVPARDVAESSNVPPAVPRMGRGVKIFDECWHSFYAECPEFSEVWGQVTSQGGDWPKGVKVIKEKLYKNETLCVPMFCNPRGGSTSPPARTHGSEKVSRGSKKAIRPPNEHQSPGRGD